MKKRWKQLTLTVFVIVLTCWRLVYPGPSFAAVSAIPAIHVAPSGSDNTDCGSESAPCQTLQYAVDKAQSLEEILVAEGTYHYDPTDNLPVPCFGGTANAAVVCILNKELTLRGGYSVDDWLIPDPAENATIIDGEAAYRGILLQRTSQYDHVASLTLEGFIVQNGFARGLDGKAGDKTFAFGGGMLADSSPVTLKDVTFRYNKAIGGDTSAEDYGGAGAGGGVALRASSSATLENVIFEHNEVQGGYGRDRGGYGIGGGLFVFRAASFQGRNLTFTDNAAIAGTTDGQGVSGDRADAQGGGAAFHESDIDLQYVIAENNRAIGGNAATYGGGSYGGAFMVQSGAYPASIVLRDTELRDNSSIGGNARNGGDGKGGAMETSNATATLERVRAIHNTARGGNGIATGKKGSAGGGGFDFGGNGHVSVLNSIISDNIVEMGQIGQDVGGGGGGLWLYGVDADIVHTTIARNRLGSANMQGQAVVLLQSADASFSYNIIEGHTSQSTVAALHVQSGNVATLERTLWANNSKDTNEGEYGAGEISNSNPIYSPSAGFYQPGSPNYDYHLNSDSSAVDEAVGSSVTTDIDSETRPMGMAPDVGADECAQLVLHMSIARPSSGTLQASWQASSSVLMILDHYEVIVSCEEGANRPDQVACGTPLDVGQQTDLLLTNLTDSKSYTVTVEARDASHNLITSDSRVSVPGEFFRVSLPMISR